jgi:hypothetical protein
VTHEFEAVSGQVETAIDQIHSTRAKAEEATDIQKNRFDYFDMFMQSLKQSQATIDSRIGFLYTIGKIVIPYYDDFCWFSITALLYDVTAK